MNEPTVDELFELLAADVDTDRVPFKHEAFWSDMEQLCITGGGAQ